MTALVDRAEVPNLFKTNGQRQRCPVCWPNGVRASPRARDYSISCWRCGDAGYVGEDPTGVLGVALDENDVGRLYVCDGPLEGEAIHRLHRCH
jgi:hypothetical protein